MQQPPTTVPAPQAAKPVPPKPPEELREGDIATLDAAPLIAIVKDSNSTVFRKAKACQRLGELGAKDAVPALAALLGDEQMSTYARYGLEPIADPAAGEALIAALPKLKGTLLVGVINSIGKRRESRAGAALAKLVHSQDANVASAAAAALGHIGGEFAMKELLAALPKSTGRLRTALADACLLCAERFLIDGKRQQGLALYATLSAPEIPKPARLAAMSAIVREETSLNRPR